MDDLDSVQDLLPCGLISVDTAGVITRANTLGLAWLGYENLIGRPFSELIRPPHLAASPAQTPLRHLDAQLRRQDGGLLAVHLDIAFPPQGGAHYLFQKIARDTETGRLRLLSTTAGQLLATHDPQSLVNTLCREVMAYLDCQTFFNFLVDPEQRRLKLNACAGISDEAAARIEWLDYGIAVCGCVARDQGRIIAEDIQHSADPRVTLIKSYGIRAYCCHPLIAQNRLLGTLSFGTRTRARFSADDIDLMATVTGQVAIALERIQTQQEIARLNQSLKHRVEELQTIFDTAPIGLAITSDPEGRHIRGNPANERMLGLPPGSELSRHRPDPAPYRILREGRELPPLELPMQRAVRGETVTGDLLDIERPDGTLISLYATATPLLDERGKPRGAVGAFLDISELKRVERALRESELFYRQTLESIPGMVFTTRPDGYCDYQSQQWVDYTGIPMSEHLGDGWNRLLHPDDRPRTYAAWQAAVEERAPYDLEYRVRRHDGCYEWFKARGQPIRNDAGQIIRWFGVAVSIQMLKKAEDDLRRMNRILIARSHSDQTTVRAQEENAYLNEICRIVVRDCGYTLAWIGYAEADHSIRPVAHAGFTLDYIADLHLTLAESNTGPTATAIRTGRTAVARNVATDPEFAPWRELALRHGYSAVIALPLLAGEVAFGAIVIYSSEPDPFNAEEVELLGNLADDLAHGIGMLRLRRAHQAMEDDLRRARDELEARVVERTLELSAANRELRRRETDLKEAQRLSSIGSYRWDMDSNHLEWSEEFYRLMGLDPSLPPIPVAEQARFYTPDTWAAAQAAIAQALQTHQPFEVDMALIRANGEHRWIVARGEIERDPDTGGSRLYGTIQDITERERAMDALRQSEERFSTTFEYAAIGKALVAPDGRLLRVNRALCELLGYSAEELFDHTLPALTHPEDRDRDQAPMAELLNGNLRAHHQEKRYLAKDGHIVWAMQATALVRDTNDTPLYFIAQIEDISERRRAEEALRQEKAFTDRLIASLPVIFYAIDSTRHFVRWNDALRELFRVPDAKMPSLELLALIHPDDRHAVAAHLQEAAEFGQFETETRLITAAGDIRVYALTGRRLDDGLLVGAGVDISERQRAELELRHYRDHLEDLVGARTEELRAANQELEAFAYSVSHDLRTPLRAIDGFSRILLEDYGPSLDAEGKRLLNVVRKNTGRMGQLIDDLLGFSRVSRKALRCDPVDMDALVRTVWEELWPTARPVHIDIQPLPTANGDAALLRQVWINLLSNALKFTSQKTEPRIAISGKRNGTETIYHVADNGAGFDMRYTDKLFGVFQRLHGHDEFEGTGIGLAIVKRVINRHGGRIWAEARIGEGATFFFTLPNNNSSQKQTYD